MTRPFRSRKTIRSGDFKMRTWMTPVSSATSQHLLTGRRRAVGPSPCSVQLRSRGSRRNSHRPARATGRRPATRTQKGGQKSTIYSQVSFNFPSSQNHTLKDRKRKRKRQQFCWGRTSPTGLFSLGDDNDRLVRRALRKKLRAPPEIAS